VILRPGRVGQNKSNKYGQGSTPHCCNFRSYALILAFELRRSVVISSHLSRSCLSWSSNAAIRSSPNKNNVEKPRSARTFIFLIAFGQTCDGGIFFQNLLFEGFFLFGEGLFQCICFAGGWSFLFDWFLFFRRRRRAKDVSCTIRRGTGKNEENLVVATNPNAQTMEAAFWNHFRGLD